MIVANKSKRKQTSVELDIFTKIMLIIFVTVVSYLAFFLLLRSLFYGQPRSMHEMMEGMMYFDTYMMLLNLGSLSLALGVGLFLSLHIRTKSKKRDELEVIRRVLSEDERMILDEVRRAGRILRTL